MWNNKSSSCLCPISLGFAIGITSALGVIFWMIWGAAQGVEGMEWGSGLLYALIVFVKCFVFGFVLACIYDFIITRCKGRCCRGADGKCNCVGKCTCGCNK